MTRVLLLLLALFLISACEEEGSLRQTTEAHTIDLSQHPEVTTGRDTISRNSDLATQRRLMSDLLRYYVPRLVYRMALSEAAELHNLSIPVKDYAERSKVAYRRFYNQLYQFTQRENLPFPEELTQLEEGMIERLRNAPEREVHPLFLREAESLHKVSLRELASFEPENFLSRFGTVIESARVLEENNLNQLAEISRNDR